MCSKLTTETLEQGVKLSSKLIIITPERHWRHSGFVIVNFKLNFAPSSSVSVVNLEIKKSCRLRCSFVLHFIGVVSTAFNFPQDYRIYFSD